MPLEAYRYYARVIIETYASGVWNIVGICWSVVLWRLRHTTCYTVDSLEDYVSLSVVLVKVIGFCSVNFLRDYSCFSNRAGELPS